MAETEYTTTARLPVETIWEFIEEMDNWAEYMTGYQSHEKHSRDDSTWVLKGDVGVLARTLQFKVHVNEWDGPRRVVFELEGQNEPMTGRGEFEMEAYEEAGSLPAVSEERGLARFLDSIARFFFRLFRGAAERGADAGAGPGAGMSKLTFRLRIDPGGPMAPMINAMMKPAMVVAAEDLANKIVGELEARRERAV